jgi:hypothetical protein
MALDGVTRRFVAISNWQAESPTIARISGGTMINIEALDKIIAVVVVILILSLFVQSLQSLLKKLFKIKSLQIETSLVHLFYYMVNNNALAVVSSKLNNSPFLRMITPGSKHPSEADDKVKALYCAVEAEFKKAGRVTASGKMMLDSLSKEDLMKFVSKVQDNELVKQFAPNLATELAAVQKKITTIESSVETIKTQYADVLSTAKIQFDQIEVLVVPLIADARKILAGQTVNADMILADIAKLGEITPDSLAAVQGKITQAIMQLSPDPNAKPAVDALQALSDALNALASAPPGISSIKTLLGRLETWYETVMQGFAERYARGMKTWAWVISALVVIFLNADLLNIYRQISTNDVQRAAILKAAEKLQTNEGQTFPDPDSAKAWYDQAKQVFNEGTNAYTSLGFEGPEWIGKTWNWLTTGHSGGDWKKGIWKALQTIFGWFVMTLLLGAGAPFWEDTLESLFGIKNLVRGKSGTKNVETKSGEGQPKP